MWENLLPYKEDAEWLKVFYLELENVNIQDNAEITKEDVKMQLRKMRNWKATGLDGIQRFWLKRFISQHQRLPLELNKNIRSLSLSSQLVSRKQNFSYSKGSCKRNAAGNHRPVACLNPLLKLMANIIVDKLYQHLENENLLLEEQNGCRYPSRGTSFWQLRPSSEIIKGGKQI